MKNRIWIIGILVCVIIFLIACVPQSILLKGTWEFAGYKAERVESIIELDSTICFDGDGNGFFYRTGDSSTSKSFTYLLSTDHKLAIIIDGNSSVVEYSIDPKTKRLSLDGLEYRLISSEVDATKIAEAEQSSKPAPTLMLMPTPTPTPTLTPTPTSTPMPVPTPTPTLAPTLTPAPTPTLTLSPITLANRKTIASGLGYTVGVKTDGTVVAFRDYSDSWDYGQCGVAGWEDIIAVAASFQHTVGLKSDGTVVATGNNEYGQCNVSTWKDIVDVAAGGTWDHGWTVGLQQNGTVVATGNNEYGQCDVSAWTNIVAVIAGGEFEKRTFGLRSDGSVVFTGEAYEDYNAIYEWRDIVALTATCGVVGLKSDGTVVGTGYIGAQIERDGWTAITEIASYEDWVMGIKANGSLISAIIYTDDSTIMMPSQDIVSCVYFGHREIDGESRDVLVGLKRDGTVVTFDNYGKTINAGLDDSIWKDIRVPESQHGSTN